MADSNLTLGDLIGVLNTFFPAKSVRPYVMGVSVFTSACISIGRGRWGVIARIS